MKINYFYFNYYADNLTRSSFEVEWLNTNSDIQV